MNIVKIIGLEENTLSEKDTLKLISLLEINDEFFNSKLDLKKIIKHADYIRHVNTVCDYENYSNTMAPDSEINNFILHSVFELFDSKVMNKSFFTIINGKDLINNIDNKGILHLNLCHFDFEKIYKKQWLSSKEIVRVKTSIVYIYISPMFANIHELYGHK